MNGLRTNIVVLDTETGGLNPLQHSIMTIGLVDWTGTRTLDLTVAEAVIHTNPRSLLVNGLDPAQVAAEGLSPVDACATIDAWLLELDHPVMIAGHNVAFDMAFMRRLYDQAGLPVPNAFSHRTLDTHTLLYALAIAGKVPTDARSSDGAFAHFGVAPPEALRHTALGDALATRDLLERLLDLCD
jgi:DNA polymerase-3 subunit epsilon